MTHPGRVDRWHADAGRRGIDVRRDNVSSILRQILERGPLPRVDLASSLVLSTGAVTRITSDLIGYGVLQELDPLQTSDVGRRRIPVDLCADSALVVGIHIGVRYTTVGVVNLRGHLVDGPHELAHADMNARSIVNQAVDAAAKLVRCRSGDAQFLGTGISTGGAVDTRAGTVAAHDVLGWHDVDVVSLVGHRLPEPLIVDSAYRAMARAEMWFGAASDVHDFVHLFMGSVIGAAVVTNRTLHEGVQARAGGVAHLPTARKGAAPCTCGRAGCLTSVAGAAAVVAQAKAAGLRRVHTLESLARLANGGDRTAKRLLRYRAEAIGDGVATLIDIIAPEKVVLAGASLLCDDHLPLVRGIVKSRATYDIDVDTAVVPTALGEPAAEAVVASATSLLESFYADPLAYLLSQPAARTGP